MELKKDLGMRESVKQTGKIVKWVMGRVYSTSRKYVYLTFLKTFLTSITPIITLLMSQLIFNSVQEKNVSLNILFIYLIVYIFIDIFSSILVNSISYLKEVETYKFNLAIKESILLKASRLCLKNYEDDITYNMLQRAEEQGEGELLDFFERLFNIIGLFIGAFSYIIILLKFNKWIFFIIFMFPTIKFFIANKINKIEFDIIFSRTTEQRRLWYLNYLITTGNSFKELKIYNLFPLFINMWKKIKISFIDQDLSIQKRRLKIFSVFEFLEQSVFGSVFVYIVYLGFKNQLLIGDVTTYSRAMISVKDHVQGIILSLAEVSKSSLYVGQLKKYMELPEEDTSDGIKLNYIESIRVEGLSYRYNPESEYVLKNVNFEVNKGETVFIVGRNGSGKTTLLKILMGLYHEYEGNIYINNVNLENIDKKDYADRIGVLFQDFAKFECTIQENIGYGNVDKMFNEDEILEICREFKIDTNDILEKDFLKTQLGFWFDHGIQISQGQWQKLALCRTYFSKSDVYFLDEPNAALDPISESELKKTIKSRFSNKINFVVVHKFKDNINNNSRVLVFDDGFLVADGEHKTLLKSNKEYNLLYESI